MLSRNNNIIVRVFQFISALLVITMLALVTVPSIASAQPAPTVTTTIMPPVITPVKKGQLVPFDGVLLNATATAQITVDKENASKECSITVNNEVEKQKAFDTTTIHDKDSEIKYTKDSLQQIIDDRDSQIKKMRDENVSSSGSGLTWGIIGFGGGVVITTAIVFLVSLTKK